MIAEIQAADVVVLGVPMYNFGVPAQLKNWIDAISRAGVTFRYTENGPEGLLKGKKVYVALTRGGKYRNTPADTQVPYLQTVLTFLGMTDVQFVYAEGLAMGAGGGADRRSLPRTSRSRKRWRRNGNRATAKVRTAPARFDPYYKENAMTTTTHQPRDRNGRRGRARSSGWSPASRPRTARA